MQMWAACPGVAQVDVGELGPADQDLHCMCRWCLIACELSPGHTRIYLKPERNLKVYRVKQSGARVVWYLKSYAQVQKIPHLLATDFQGWLDSTISSYCPSLHAPRHIPVFWNTWVLAHNVLPNGQGYRIRQEIRRNKDVGGFQTCFNFRPKRFGSNHWKFWLRTFATGVLPGVEGSEYMDFWRWKRSDGLRCLKLDWFYFPWPVDIYFCTSYKGGRAKEESWSLLFNILNVVAWCGFRTCLGQTFRYILYRINLPYFLYL